MQEPSLTGTRGVLRVLGTVGPFLRDGWLVFGIVLLICFGLELAYRVQGFIRVDLLNPPPSEVLLPDPNPQWMEAYLREQGASTNLEWRPYVYFRRTPFAGTYVNVDADGRRVTIPQGPEESVIWMFGGSTMWGSFQRDAMTIPSVLSAALATEGRSAHVVNWGETGYVFTQEVFELLLQLRAGQRPDVVVFYDGINDVVASLQYRSGVPQNEAHRIRDFDVGRRMFAWQDDIVVDGQALATLAGIALRRSRLASRLSALRSGMASPPDPSLVVEELLGIYVETVRLVEGMARLYGFVPIYVWQPSLHVGRKPLTDEETTLMQRIDGDAFHQRVKAVHSQMAARIDSAMVGVADNRFLNLSAIFAATPRPIFVDVIGHTLEEANPIIVEHLLPVVLLELDNPPVR